MGAISLSTTEKSSTIIHLTQALHYVVLCGVSWGEYRRTLRAARRLTLRIYRLQAEGEGTFLARSRLLPFTAGIVLVRLV